jgi:hypothetical protein
MQPNPSAINSQQQVQIALNDNILKPREEFTNNLINSNNPFEDNFSSLNDNELFGLEFDRMRVKNDQNLLIPIDSSGNFDHMLNLKLVWFLDYYLLQK